MHVSVYITTKNAAEARRIAKQLVKESLVACANIIPKIESLYWWDGKIQQHGEAAIIAKTVKGKEKKIIRRVKELHSDSVPCVVFWPIAGGNKDYLGWVGKETSKRKHS